MFNERQRNTIAASLTVVILGLLWILLLLFALSRPYPPPPEFGVEVNLGISLDGMGNIQPDIPSEVSQFVPPTPSSAEQLATQDDSDFAMPAQREPVEQTPTPPTPEEAVAPQPEQPQINPQALFPPRRPTEGGSEGVTERPGDQGQPDGTRDATAHVGAPGAGDGISFSLAGRQANNLATPAYDSPDQGTVVVRIWVNQQGVVIRAEAGQRGTTVNDRTLWREAESAAMRSNFRPDANAPDTQVGTITYRFVRLN